MKRCAWALVPILPVAGVGAVRAQSGPTVPAPDLRAFDRYVAEAVHVEPTGSFRSQFTSQNVVYPIGGMLVETISGMPLERRRALTFVRDGMGNPASLQLFNVSFVRAPRAPAARTP